MEDTGHFSGVVSQSRAKFKNIVYQSMDILLDSRFYSAPNLLVSLSSFFNHSASWEQWDFSTFCFLLLPNMSPINILMKQNKWKWSITFRFGFIQNPHREDFIRRKHQLKNPTDLEFSLLFFLSNWTDFHPQERKIFMQF